MKKSPVNPLVTVITPTYNCSKYLGVTVDSILSQSYQNIEYIVVDDGSTDGTAQVLNEYRHDERLKSIWQKNQGAQKACNVALGIAHGKYVMRINADDPLLPGAVLDLVTFLEKNDDVIAVYPDWYEIGEEGEIIQLLITKEWDYVFMLRRHFCIPGTATMFRSWVLKRMEWFDPSFHYLDDFDLWFRMGLLGKFARLPVTLACWRRWQGQISGDLNENTAKERLALMDKLFGNYATDGMKKYKAEAYCWANLVASLDVPIIRRKFYYLWRAVRYYPPVLIQPMYTDKAIKYIRKWVRGR